MLLYANFMKSDNPEILGKYPNSISVLEDAEGNDWYEVQANFNDETLKIVFDHSGLIVSYSYDVSTLFPLGYSITEIAESDLPSEFFNGGEFDFIEGKVFPHPKSLEQLIDEASCQLKQLQVEATVKIDTLQDAIDLNMAEKGDETLLKAWKIYRVKLSKIDILLSPKIDWPEKPE